MTRRKRPFHPVDDDELNSNSSTGRGRRGMNDNRRVATLDSVMEQFESDPALMNLVRYDEFKARVIATKIVPEITDKGPWPKVWEEHWDIALERYFERQHGMIKAKQFIERGLLLIARENSFHPVREYFDKLKWDDKPRLDDYLTKGFGAENTDLNRAYGSKFLIAAVRRIRKPGAKVDSMPVFEGEQGSLKSTALQETVPDPEWYKDGVGDIRNKDTLMSLSGKLIIEWTELKSIRKVEREAFKHFMSQQVDEYRAPWDRRPAPHPRQGVFAGTTNEFQYIDDPTGGRRFWPVKVGVININWIKANRDQLWAEASVREGKGENHWLDSGRLRKAAEQSQVVRAVRDEWADPMTTYCSGKEFVIVREFLVRALGIPEKDIHVGLQTRCSDILVSMGWTANQERMKDGAKPPPSP